MGFFGKLFEKKICSVCEGEIGLLGNRKLEDGNLCKECAQKLSPWFDDRRHSTVEQIKAQLEYREANKEKVAAFQVTRSFGEYSKVLLDEDAGVFMVTSESSPQRIAAANPDVLAFSDVTGCDLDIDESREELKRETNDGKEISYNPPRYRYEYDFYVKIHVRNPFFDDMQVKLNSSTVSMEYQQGRAAGKGMGLLLSGGAQSFSPERDVEYRQYKQMGEELKRCLMQVRKAQREEAAAAAAPKAAVTCPWCGATSIPDQNGCCEYCGGSVNG